MSLTCALVWVLPLSSLKAGQAPSYLINCQSPSLQAYGTACHSIRLAASNFGVHGCHSVLAGRGGLQPTAHLAEPRLAQPPEPLLAPHGLCWLKEPHGFGEVSEHKQQMLAQPPLLIAGCHFATLQQQVWGCRNPLSPRELGAMPSGVQTSASSLPRPCFLHRCLLLQPEESSKGNQSLKQTPGREKAWVEVPVTWWQLQAARAIAHSSAPS